MPQDEPIRLTAEEAQAVINAQRAEIAALRNDLWCCQRHIQSLHERVQNDLKHHSWLKDYGSKP